MSDPTAWADDVAAEMRRYYEANREGWWERRSELGQLVRAGVVADNLMLELLGIAQRRIRERAEKEPPHG